MAKTTVLTAKSSMYADHKKSVLDELDSSKDFGQGAETDSRCDRKPTL